MMVFPGAARAPREHQPARAWKIAGGIVREDQRIFPIHTQQRVGVQDHLHMLPAQNVWITCPIPWPGLERGRVIAGAVEARRRILQDKRAIYANIDADDVRPNRLAGFIAIRRIAAAVPRIESDRKARLRSLLGEISFAIRASGPHVSSAGIGRSQNRIAGAGIIDAEAVGGLGGTVADTHIRLEGEGLNDRTAVEIGEEDRAALAAGSGRDL